jgi:hypothetical protein
MPKTHIKEALFGYLLYKFVHLLFQGFFSLLTKKLTLSFRKKIILIYSLIIIAAQYSYTQTLELGILVGGSNYQGDLASSEFKVITKQTDLALGGFLRYNFNESFSLKLQVVSTELHADDANSSFDVLKQRNLRFFSPLLDASLRFEWQFLENLLEYEQAIRPYVAFGGSFFTFKPQAHYKGQIYELQPLHTEGQGLPSFPDRKPYNLYNASVVGGLGLKFVLNEDITIGLDFSIHYTFTDYLDDVSTTYPSYQELAFNYGVLSADISYQVDDFFNLEQTSPLGTAIRGNPNLNDFFFITGINLSYNLFNPDRGKGIGCPTF